MIMFFHYFGANPIDRLSSLVVLQKFSILGQTGVSLFFVLSGFLISRILISSKNSSGYFSGFLRNRALRIFPLYFGFLTLYFILIPIFTHGGIRPLSDQIYYWLYLQNFAITFDWFQGGPRHFWSLAVEEHFYLFWPFVIYFCSIQRLLKVIFAIILISLALRIYMVGQGYEVFYFTLTRFDALAFGALLAVIEYKGLIRLEYIRYLSIAFFSVSVPILFLWMFFSGQSFQTIQVIKFTLIGFIYFLALYFVCCMSRMEYSLTSRILSHPMLLYTGKISYGLYVYHALAFDAFHRLFGSLYPVIDLVGSFSSAFIISAISYHFFEKVFLKLKVNRRRQAWGV